MKLHKLGTQALRAANICTLEVHTCSTGYTLHDPRLKAQTATVYKTALQAVNEAIVGVRPEKIPTKFGFL